ncbi:unnamed protein product [Mesocestoides corti]|uniref:Uncharacterized protein n=1 Tax=Mesocestoides corti TaxID=53468 RepID=A0A0R3UCK4_MESCO|nr:unnamed protein product [Mesocestoides corti]
MGEFHNAEPHVHFHFPPLRRVVVPASMEARKGQPAKVVAGVRLPGFNSHSLSSKEAYLNAAAAIGQTPEEVDLFIKRLDKVLTDFKRGDRSRSGTGEPTT